MRGAIVELDRTPALRPARLGERALITALVAASGLLAVAIWTGGASWPRSAPTRDADAAMMTPTERLAVTARTDAPRAGILAFAAPDVVLASMPDRLVNEPGPSELRAVIRVRGGVGVASVERPAVIMWTERGTTYWLSSPTRTTEELIGIAETLR